MAVVTAPRASLDAVTGLLAQGVTVAGAAARLGLPVDLVATMVDELDRWGLVRTARGPLAGLPPSDCPACAPRAACRGCPLAGDMGVRERH